MSTLKAPLAGQYAGGTPSTVAFGSCSIDRYCCMRSKLRSRIHMAFIDLVAYHLPVACITKHLELANYIHATLDVPPICSSLDSFIHQMMRLLNCTGHLLVRCLPMDEGVMKRTGHIEREADARRVQRGPINQVSSEPRREQGRQCIDANRNPPFYGKFMRRNRGAVVPTY